VQFPEKCIDTKWKRILENWIKKVLKNFLVKVSHKEFTIKNNYQKMKNILNRLINHETLSREEAKNVLITISNGGCTTAKKLFLTVYMMRSITIEEPYGFRAALLELYSSRSICYNTIDLCGTGGDGKIPLIFRH
jgi:hypothetical protein